MGNNQYNKLTFKAALELTAPHSWPASIVPVLLGAVLSCSFERAFSPPLFLAVLAISVLLQSSVNTINDYVDFMKGTDTEENSDDPSDASIVYNKINPRAALILGILMIAAAAVIGIYVILSVGWVPLVFGGIGVAVIGLYSGGNKSISHLPIGELVSGGVMGWLITIAAYYVLGSRLNPALVYYALPTVITIGMIMFTNNICDIERDSNSGRKTFPVLIGRKKAALLLKVCVVVVTLLTAHIIFWGFRGGAFLIPVMIIHMLSSFITLMRSEATSNVRLATLGATLNIHKLVNTYYIAAIAINLILELM